MNGSVKALVGAGRRIGVKYFDYTRNKMEYSGILTKNEHVRKLCSNVNPTKFSWNRESFGIAFSQLKTKLKQMMMKDEDMKENENGNVLIDNDSLYCIGIKYLYKNYDLSRLSIFEKHRLFYYTPDQVDWLGSDAEKCQNIAKTMKTFDYMSENEQKGNDDEKETWELKIFNQYTLSQSGYLNITFPLSQVSGEVYLYFESDGGPATVEQVLRGKIAAREPAACRLIRKIEQVGDTATKYTNPFDNNSETPIEFDGKQILPKYQLRIDCSVPELVSSARTDLSLRDLIAN